LGGKLTAILDFANTMQFNQTQIIKVVERIEPLEPKV